MRAVTTSATTLLFLFAAACSNGVDLSAPHNPPEEDEVPQPEAAGPPLQCGEGTVMCDDICVSNSTTLHCGGCDPCTLAGANSGVVCIEGECVYTCQAGFGDANGDVTLGNEGDGCACASTDEVCDGRDNDCDEIIDEGVGNGCGGCEPLEDLGEECGECGRLVCMGNNDLSCEDKEKTVYFLDQDGDGFGALGGEGLTLCEPTIDQRALVTGDCNDSNIDIHPDAEEICDDGLDNNCDELIDIGCCENPPPTFPPRPESTLYQREPVLAIHPDESSFTMAWLEVPPDSANSTPPEEGELWIERMSVTGLNDNAPPVQVNTLAHSAMITSHSLGVDLIYRDVDRDALSFARLDLDWTEVEETLTIAEGIRQHSALSTPNGETFVFYLDELDELQLQKIDTAGQLGGSMALPRPSTARDIYSFKAARSGNQLFAVVFGEGPGGRMELAWVRSTTSLEAPGLDQVTQVNASQQSRMALAARPSGGYVLALTGPETAPIFLVRIPENGPWERLTDPEEVIEGAVAPLDLTLVSFEDGLMLLWIEGGRNSYSLRGIRLDAEGLSQGEVLDFATIADQTPRRPLTAAYRPIPSQPPSPWFMVGLSEGRTPNPDRATARLFSRPGVPFCFE